MTSATQITAGYFDACAVQAANAFCWGLYGYSEFAPGGGPSSDTPVQISGWP